MNGPTDGAATRGGRPDPAGPSTRTIRRIVIVVFTVACLVAGAVAIVAGVQGHADPPPQAPPAAAGQLPSHTTTNAVPAPSSPAPSTTPRATRAQASPPAVLDIPAIRVHTRLLDLGLNKDGTLQVPGKPLQAGWYDRSPAPGQPGPAVILGHVDSYQTGPAVFYRLGALRPHEQIRVTRADHTAVTFQVDAVRSYAKKAFPTLQVYGNTPDPELRLITCSDWNNRTHTYDDNTVVYAHLAGS